MVKKRAKSNESSLIGRIEQIAWRPTAVLPVSVGDDAAIWRPRTGYQAILSCDWFLEGTHFLAAQHPPESVGWKCLTRAISDVAAMGGVPRCFLLSLALPSTRTGAWLQGFLNGLSKASRALKCPIAGGDTTRRQEILINITVVGQCRSGSAVLRSGARPGDAIFVSGRLGEAQYGLQLLRSGKKKLSFRDRRLRKHLYPRPRLAIGAALAQNRLATAMMDLSDGLSSDLARLCAASGVGARIAAQQLPTVRMAERDQKGFDAAELALHGGDDYELLFTVAKRNLARIPKSIGNVALTQIGVIAAQKKVLLVLRNKAVVELRNLGWDPFRS